jgi:hypothetical protein
MLEMSATSKPYVCFSALPARPVCVSQIAFFYHSDARREVTWFAVAICSQTPFNSCGQMPDMHNIPLSASIELSLLWSGEVKNECVVLRVIKA